MDEIFGKFWICVAVVLCTLIVTVGANHYNTNSRKGEALLRGIDPVAVACAFDSYNNPTCAVLAARKP